MPGRLSLRAWFSGTRGWKVSSGWVQLTNEDVTDLYGRTGLKVVVLADTAPRLRNEVAARTPDHQGALSQTASPQAQPSAWSSRRASAETGPVATAFGLY